MATELTRERALRMVQELAARVLEGRVRLSTGGVSWVALALSVVEKCLTASGLEPASSSMLVVEVERFLGRLWMQEFEAEANDHAVCEQLWAGTTRMAGLAGVALPAVRARAPRDFDVPDAKTPPRATLYDVQVLVAGELHDAKASDIAVAVARPRLEVFAILPPKADVTPEDVARIIARLRDSLPVVAIYRVIPHPGDDA